MKILCSDFCTLKANTQYNQNSELHNRSQNVKDAITQKHDNIKQLEWEIKPWLT